MSARDEDPDENDRKCDRDCVTAVVRIASSMVVWMGGDVRAGADGHGYAGFEDAGTAAGVIRQEYARYAALQRGGWCASVVVGKVKSAVIE